ncbi:unnamed protein product [Lupinus luteus]|uniref:Protein kinase domain-containing protein n=1 Tax=Lupinus luteus TaxID=3873 RepID=A0AAV1XD20_LUPLU
MKNAPLLFIFIFLYFLSVSKAISKLELQSLLEFKKGITDPQGKVLETWKAPKRISSAPCPIKWVGILCDDLTGNVTAIALDNFNLGGELKFETLLGLKMLQKLSLSGNHFIGRLPPSFGTLTTLQRLDLSNNQFSGPIPDTINDLWGLHYLNLSLNGFKGGFPVLTNLQQLTVLDLHSNDFWCNISEVVSSLRNVEIADLSDNMFYGGPQQVRDIRAFAHSVKFLNLSQNRLDGPFFGVDSMTLFGNLEILDLSNNMIEGQLPSFGSFSNKFRVLRLRHNLLLGSVPEELLQSSLFLEELDLSGNGFTGSISVINSTTLNILNLSSNRLSGSLPSSLSRCKVVDFSRNMFSGDISVIQSWEDTLEAINLSSNRLSGSLPPVLGAYSKLSRVDLSLNGLTGSIPGSLVTSSSLTSLNLSGNKFTGPLPLQSSGASQILLMPPYHPLEYLDVSSNFLEGDLPSDISKMSGLKLLNLARNGFTGELPNELSKLIYLGYLDLSNNQFTGKIPDKLSSNLIVFDVSRNDLSGHVPENLQRFPPSSFHPGNENLILKDKFPANSVPVNDKGKHHSSKGLTVAIILASLGAAVMIIFVLLALHRAHVIEFHERIEFNDQNAGRGVKLRRLTRPSPFKYNKNAHPPTTSMSLSDDHLLSSNSRSLSGQIEFTSDISDIALLQGTVTATSASAIPNLMDNPPASSERNSFHSSPLSSLPHFIAAGEKSVMLDVYSPDRLAGELFFLDSSLAFTAEELSRAPAEVLGRSNHGTLYKATLDSGHLLTVKWLRVGLVKHKKEFAREVKRMGSMRHPNIVPLRAYYWGPREQERLLLADYIHGDNLALHLYETTPGSYSPLSFSQRLRVAVDVARCVLFLHDRGLPHGNLKPTNILLSGPDYSACLTDYGLHRLMTPDGIAEQIRNLGALGYCAPELAMAPKPVPSFKADVYALGVILMEILTRKSAGDIISGQLGAVDLTDWVRLCAQEGRVMNCIDRDIAGEEESFKGMYELFAISLRCVLLVNERPNIRQVYDDLCSILV